MLDIRLHVQVVAAETGAPLPGLFIKAYDKDLVFDDLLGGERTNTEGRATITCDEGDFKELFDRRPDVYFKVYTADRSRLLFETSDCVHWGTRRATHFTIRVPLEQLRDASRAPAVHLSGDAGGVETPPAIGDSLVIAGRGLAPATAHDVELHDDRGLLFTSRVMTDSSGVIESTVLWPQLGLDDPRSNSVYSVDEADQRWRGRSLRVRVLHAGRIRASGAVTVGGFDRPFVLNTDASGRMLNGFEDGKGEVAAAVYNLRHPGEVRVHLVESQADWRPGDRFAPVRLRSGKPAFADVRPDERGRFRVVLAGAGDLGPGAYDFIVRPLRYGYEDDDDPVLRASDIVTRRVTGVVIRRDFWRSKVVHLGCVNMMSLSGRAVSGAPYFRYADAFAEGEDVWVAVDPAALPPVKIGKMAAIYVVPSKTQAQWDSDKSLSHLAQLGGNVSVIKFKTQVGCINYNKRLVWPAATTPGSYDVVLDFGNGLPDPQFLPDDTYTIATPPENGDIIDGYMVPGFRIIKDPGVYTDPAFGFVGGFDYVNDGSSTVVDDDGLTITVPLTARVKFPADTPGATLPGQISTARASYPMTIIVHGNGHDYRAYDYLLSHWAANGFIAASIHLNGNQTASDRAKVLFAHIAKLQAKFGAKAQNTVGILGHSRGGEGVATAPRLIQHGGLPYNLKAVISLAPTNQHVDETIAPPWATPYCVIYGSLDRDVTGEAGPGQPMLNSGFALYDKADGQTKAMLFVYGATHDRFLTAPGSPDLDYGWLSSADQARALSATAHQVVARAYTTAFFRQQLLGDLQYAELFKGEWVPPSVATADSGKVKVFHQYRDAAANRKTVDDFEGAHTATSWQSSTIGGGVSQSGLAANPAENRLYMVDSAHSPHQTSGLVPRWNSSGDRLEFTIPAAHKNASGFRAISFRVTQKYDPTGTINPIDADQDFYVLLRDALTNERAVKVSKFGRIPYPFVRGPGWFGDVIKSALCSIRIPLHAFTIECAGAARVDLTQLEKIAFVYQFVSTGEVEIDDVEFTQ